MKKIAILFDGQGAQYPGMGKDLYENNEIFRNTIDYIDDHASIDIKKIMFDESENNEAINNTRNTQLIMFAYEIGLIKCLEKKIDSYEKHLGGFSLGECSALTYANVVSLEEGVKLVDKRSQIMNDAQVDGNYKMAAVLLSNEQDIKEAIEKVSSGFVQIANYNSPAQIVISGEERAVDDCCVLLKEKNVKCIPLKVSGAFHTSLLNDASEKFYVTLKDELKFSDKDAFLSNTQIYNNYLGDVYESEIEIIKDKLAKQMCNPVRFVTMIENMINNGVEEFIEVGTGKTLINFVSKIIQTIELDEEKKKRIKLIAINNESTLNDYLDD